MKYCRYSLLICLSFFLNNGELSAQTTTTELGKMVLAAFQQDSISKLDKLIPTIAEMKQLADQIGISKADFDKAAEEYPGLLSEFHENISMIYSDTAGYNLHWRDAIFEKVITSVDSIPLNNKDPNSRIIPLTGIKIYFLCGTSKFVLILNDVFQCSAIWKIGNNITLRKLK